MNRRFLSSLFTRIMLFCALAPTILQGQNEPVDAEWCVNVVIQARNDLGTFAIKNLKDMVQVGSSKSIKLLAELHKSGEKIWRYTIEKNHCTVDEVLERDENIKPADEIIESMKWAKRKVKAKHYGLILWNHGTGVYDPQWGGNQPYYMKSHKGLDGESENPRTRIEGITTRASRKKLPTNRGIMFDEERQTYITNEEFRRMMQVIHQDVLNGEKLELLGMDACFMGMFEVHYQIREYVNHIVSSQEFEFAQGWSYGPLLRRLVEHAPDGKAFGKAIVDTYKEYYQNKTNFFTLSNFDASRTELIKENIDQVSLALMLCKKQDKYRTKKLISRARNQCLQFSTPDYIDLYSFYHELSVLLNAQGSSTLQSSKSQELRVDDDVMSQLKRSLKEGMALIKVAITSNTAGRHLARAQGVSICFPQGQIDRSYINTEFAKDSYWTQFIYDHLIN